jgi:AcrR family transcriptional regulator
MPTTTPSGDSLTPESTPTRRRARIGTSRRADQRREEIIAAAIALFAEKGFLATSTKDIGDAIGMLGGSLYYHIRSKEQLLYEILRGLHTFALEEVRAIDAEGGGPLEKLRRLVRNHVINQDVSRIRLFDAEFHHLEPEHRTEIAAMRREYRDYVVGQIEAAQRDGLADPTVNALATGTALLGMLNSMASWFNPEGRIGVAEMADSVDRIVTGSLLPAQRLPAQSP